MQRTMKKLEKPEPFYRQVQARIKEYILENKLQPGDALPPETELARQLGVGRNAVREASKALEALGILETRHGSGLFVGGFSFDTLLETMPYGILFGLQHLKDLLQVRQVLETGMISEVVRTISREQLQEVQRVVDQMYERITQGEPFTEEDQQFHQLLFEPLHNKFLLKLLDIFWLTFQKASQWTDLSPLDPQRTYQEHVNILMAVRSGDARKAHDALVSHYAVIEERLQQAQETVVVQEKA